MKKHKYKCFLSKEILIYLTRASRSLDLGHALVRFAVVSFSLLCIKSVFAQKCQKSISGVLIISLFISVIGCSLDGDLEKAINDLKSENVIVQNNAVVSLGEEEEKRVVPMLIELFKSAELRELKINIIKALGKIGDDSSVATLIETLNDKDNEFRIVATEALGKIKDPKVVPYLIRNLEDKDVQLVTIWALGSIGDRSASAMLAKLLDDEDKYVRYNAIKSLERIGKGE